MLDLRPLAFRRPEVHHSSRSSAMEEALELLELVIEGVVEWSERSFAFRSLRSPTFSTPGSVHERSAENIVAKQGYRIESAYENSISQKGPV